MNLHFYFQEVKMGQYFSLPSLPSLPRWYDTYFLFRQVEENNLESVEKLLSDNWDPNIKFGPNIKFSGDTPLHLAARNGYGKMCKLLISYGADVNRKSDDGYSPLHLAIIYNHTSTCKFLIRKGADVNSATPYDTTLQLATQFGLASVCKSLISHKVDLQKNGRALIIAIVHGNLSICKMMIKNAQNEAIGIVNFSDNGWSVLAHAFGRGYMDLCKFLISHGADTKNLHTIHLKRYQKTQKWRQEYLMRQAIKIFFWFRIRSLDNPRGYIFPNVYVFGDTIISGCFPELSRENLFEVEQMLLKHLGIDDKVEPL